MKMNFRKVFRTIREEIEYCNASIKFTYETRILPHFVKHYNCKFLNPNDKKEYYGWYILDRNKRMIPWIHFQKKIQKMLLFAYMKI